MPEQPYSARYRAYVMSLLVLVYTLNFIDRQIVSILAIPIKADLALSDTQLGLMGGLAFALFYTVLAIPIAMWADRSSRTFIIALALAVWSAMTAVCGFAQNFWQLFLARVGVGVGEAGGVAPAHALISDLYPAQQRARALSVYSFGIPIGSALGIIFGGLIATKIDWRYAFFAVGLAGVVVAPIFKLTVREPRRGQLDATPSAQRPAAWHEVVAELRHKRSFWALSIGASFSSMVGYGLFFWLPSFLVRSYGLSLLDASLLFGAILLIGGLAGTWGGGYLADRLGQTRRSAYATVPAIAFLATIPFFLLAILSTNLWIAFFALLVPTALGLAWLGPVFSAVQHVVPPAMRASAAAIFMFVINLLGLGGGTLLPGVLSDALSTRFGEDALRYAIVSGSGFYVIAAGFFLYAAKRLEADWKRL